jgi:DNA-binding transcriptional MerR regulator
VSPPVPLPGVAPLATLSEGVEVVGMQIGEVASRTGLSLRTIRFYEEVGILTASRSQGGFRLFCEADVQRLLLVRQMKPLGFSVEEMRELLAALDAVSDVTRSSVHPSMVERLAHFQSRVREQVAAMRAQVAAAEMFAAELDARVAATRRVVDASA